MRLAVSSAILAAALLSSSAFAQDGENRRVRFVNASDEPIVALNGSSARSSEWGRNLLRAPLAVGQSVAIDFTDRSGTCAFDFRASFASGAEAVEYAMDVCEIGTLTFE